MDVSIWKRSGRSKFFKNKTNFKALTETIKIFVEILKKIDSLIRTLMKHSKILFECIFF